MSLQPREMLYVLGHSLVIAKCGNHVIDHQTGDLLNKGWHMKYYTGVKKKKKQTKETRRSSLMYLYVRTYLRDTPPSQKRQAQNCLQGMLHLGKKLKGKSF